MLNISALTQWLKNIGLSLTEVQTITEHKDLDINKMIFTTEKENNPI